MPNPVHVVCAVAKRLTDYRPPVLPSLGDALAVLAAPASRVPELVSQALTASPWCAVVLLTEEFLSAPDVMALMPILPRTTIVLAGGIGVDPTTLHAALQLRGTPDAAEVSGYLRLRQLPRALIGAVEDALASPESESEKVASGPHRSSINRRLAAFGRLRAADWRALFRIIQATGRSPLHEATTSISTERAALATGTDPRTLRAKTKELLGVRARPALDTPGWEWKVEAALRRHGYLPWPSPTRRSSAGHAMPVFLEA